MEISYKLPDFEGPLDLLLYLVQKNKLNIYDIPIHELLEQYLSTIQTMQELDMEVATEFFRIGKQPSVHLKFQGGRLLKV